MASLAAVGIACLFGLAVASAASTTVHPMAGSEARFALIVHHTDGEREWAYDPKSHIGHLDKALDEAHARGWTVVSIKDDWRTICPR